MKITLTTKEVKFAIEKYLRDDVLAYQFSREKYEISPSFDQATLTVDVTRIVEKPKAENKS